MFKKKPLGQANTNKSEQSYAHPSTPQVSIKLKATHLMFLKDIDVHNLYNNPPWKTRSETGALSFSPNIFKLGSEM